MHGAYYQKHRRNYGNVVIFVHILNYSTPAGAGKQVIHTRNLTLAGRLLAWSRHLWNS